MLSSYHNSRYGEAGCDGAGRVLGSAVLTEIGFVVCGIYLVTGVEWRV